MAKDKSRGRYTRYIRGNVGELLAIGTLASETLVSAPFDETVNERTFATSMVATWSMRDFTDGGGIGPIMVGVAHGDYTDPEIEAWVENTGSWNEGDLVQQREVGRRLIRKVGTFDSIGRNNADEVVVLNDGKPLRTNLKWMLLQGQTLRLWAFNLGSSPVQTTVPDIDVQGWINLFPK